MSSTEPLDFGAIDRDGPNRPAGSTAASAPSTVGATAPDQQSPASPDVVVFVSRAIAAELSDPEVVADLICTEFDKRDTNRLAKFTVERVPTDPDNYYRIQRTTESGKQAVLDLYTLCVLQDKTEQTRAPIRRVFALAFNILAGLFLLVGAGTFRRGNRAKGLDQKLQLVFCLFVLCTLVAYLVVVVWALVDGIHMVLGGTPTINWPQWVVVVSAVLGLLFPGFRNGLIAVANGYQQMMRYLWTSQTRNEVTGQLRSLVDRINRRADIDRIHLVGYGLGSLVVLDTVMSQSSRVPAPLLSIRTLTTIGCPYDLVRTLKPNYPDLRTLALAPGDLPTWTNIYAPIDALGSDFQDRPKRALKRYVIQKVAGRTGTAGKAAEPVTTEPVTTEPVATEPVTTEPPSADPTPTMTSAAPARGKSWKRSKPESTPAPLRVAGWESCLPTHNLTWNADLTLDPVNFLMLASISSHMTYWSNGVDSDTVWGIVVHQIAAVRGTAEAVKVPRLVTVQE